VYSKDKDITVVKPKTPNEKLTGEISYQGVKVKVDVDDNGDFVYTTVDGKETKSK
jgi:hypothetical protein